MTYLSRKRPREELDEKLMVNEIHSQRRSIEVIVIDSQSPELKDQIDSLKRNSFYDTSQTQGKLYYPLSSSSSSSQSTQSGFKLPALVPTVSVLPHSDLFTCDRGNPSENYALSLDSNDYSYSYRYPFTNDVMPPGVNGNNIHNFQQYNKGNHNFNGIDNFNAYNYAYYQPNFHEQSSLFYKPVQNAHVQNENHTEQDLRYQKPISLTDALKSKEIEIIDLTNSPPLEDLVAKKRRMDNNVQNFMTSSKGFKLPPPPPESFDDKDGHYIVKVNDDLTERYQIRRLLGQGTFGKVVEVLDRQLNTIRAIKIIRSVQKYRDASKIEIKVLTTLRKKDPENK
ncbi:dual specificity protein kinase kns1 [Nowakowskiella sp. JEL0078]|nr:dual specificity protein kinase kns1 [Nowakowskiella sp. JEL0078]